MLQSDYWGVYLVTVKLQKVTLELFNRSVDGNYLVTDKCVFTFYSVAGCHIVTSKPRNPEYLVII